CHVDADLTSEEYRVHGAGPCRGCSWCDGTVLRAHEDSVDRAYLRRAAAEYNTFGELEEFADEPHRRPREDEMDTKTLLPAVAVCDALGAPFEEAPRRRRPDHLPERSFLAEDGTRPLVAILGGTALYGTFTDDTQIALAVVDALRRAPSDPLPAYRENLVAW